MSLIYILHIIIQIFIISIPFFPLYILKKGLYLLPLFITLQWLLLDGCILTLADKKKNKNDPDFMHGILKKLINNKISKQQAENFNSLLLVFIVTIIAYRFKIDK
jgi:hypothetical protein